MFGDMVLVEITPKLLAGYKTQRRIEKAAPAIQCGNARMGMVPGEPYAPSLDGVSAE